MDDFRKHLKESLKDEELRYKIVNILVGIRIQYKLSKDTYNRVFLKL